jgi:hypothetical protein
MQQGGHRAVREVGAPEQFVLFSLPRSERARQAAAMKLPFFVAQITYWVLNTRD